jgi:hypothetical protein
MPSPYWSFPWFYLRLKLVFGQDPQFTPAPKPTNKISSVISSPMRLPRQPWRLDRYPENGDTEKYKSAVRYC